jgi:ribosome production factor 2
VPTSVKPVLIFNGDIFEYDPIFKRFRNLMHDMFCQGTQVPGVDVLYGTRLVINITADEAKKVYVRFYTSNLKEADVKVSSTVSTNDSEVLEEIGPKLDMVLRRSDVADDTRWKAATKVFKAKKKEGVKFFPRLKLLAKKY